MRLGEVIHLKVNEPENEKAFLDINKYLLHDAEIYIISPMLFLLSHLCEWH